MATHKGSKAVNGLIDRLAERPKNSKRNYAHYQKSWPDNWYNKETQWGKSPK